MSDRTIKAILFDLGETLLDFGKISTTRVFREGARSSHAYLKSMGQAAGPFEWYCWKNLIRLRLRTFISSLTGNDFDAFGLLQKVGRRTGFKLTDEQWTEYAWRWYAPLGAIGKVQEDTAQALAALRDGGLKLGIVSNTFVNRESLERHMKEYGILDFFPVRIYSYECAQRKPSREIFEAAAEAIGEPFENIAFVGDRIDNDIEPALKHGMLAVMKQAYTNKGKQAPEGAFVIRRISELPELIFGANGERERSTK